VVVGPEVPEHPVHATDQLEGERYLLRITRATVQRQIVADGVGVGPEIASLRASVQPGAAREDLHQGTRLIGTGSGSLEHFLSDAPKG
jgi:hypothetical protein